MGRPMAEKLFESSAVSAFCGSMSTMLSAGIQIEEATLMLAENRTGSRFAEVCNEVYRQVAAGKTLADAMRATGAFPTYACDMVATGEHSGHLEKVLRNLELYYGEEERIFVKLRSSMGYPLALLLIMAVILLCVVVFILPVFNDVHQNMAGSLVAASFTSVKAATIIGWVAFGITMVCAIVTAYVWNLSRSETGRARVMKIFEKLSFTKQALYQLALSRFAAALATFISAGATSEVAMEKARSTVDHEELSERLAAAHESMVDLDNPHSLPQALDEYHIFEPLYARMLNVGARSGRTDETLVQFSQVFFDDAVGQIDRSLDKIEPLLAAFLTVAVGLTIIAVMLPLIGIMGSIS